MKAKKQFDQIHEQSITIVKKIKLKNDNINKKTGVESQTRLLEEIKRDKQFFQESITRLNMNIKKMEENYLDPDSIRKVQVLKKQAKKQISRNQYLIKELINSSFQKISEKEIIDETIKVVKKKPRQIEAEFKPTPQRPNPHVLQIQQQDSSEYEIQNHINIEKNKILKDFEHNIVKINDIINQTADMAYKQGQDLDIITDETTNAYKNTLGARENIEEASVLQKKSKTKYLIMVLLIIVLCGAIAGLYVFI